MKRYVLFLTGLCIFGFTTIAGAQEKPSGQLPPTTPVSSAVGSTIDDINIPFDVINFIQTEHMSYTVTQAKKVTYQGKNAYNLKIDNDDTANNGGEFFLLYSDSWLLMGKNLVMEKPPEAPAPKKEEKKPEPKPEERKPEQREEGGRGNGSAAMTTTTTTTTAPAPAPEEPAEDD